MVRLELPDFLQKKHPLRIRKSSDDALFDLNIERCNETQQIAVGSRNVLLLFKHTLSILS
jgi:hypothetical protein